LFDRYFGQLVELARQKLSAAPRSVEDEEDLALSAIDSFFRRAGGGQFPQLSQRHELWSLLVTIVSRKAVNRLKKDQALKRGGTPQECAPHVANGNARARSLDSMAAKEPPPDALVQLNDELHRRLAMLHGDRLREVAVLRLQGYAYLEIAAELGVAERTVRRKIDRIRRTWEETLE
jgi:DNA-directed RNA polymerase specialized sigma24 family protein